MYNINKTQTERATETETTETESAETKSTTKSNKEAER